MITHFDGDAFFASVERAKNYKLRGKPIVVGAERGAATSVSYEAKRLGVGRSLPIHEIRKQYPEVIIVSSDYGAYSIYAHRMYEIARRFTDVVEEYSIDECFAEVKDEAMARKIKETLERELDITFGVGLAPNKVLAKIASKWQKPAGFTIITLENRTKFLKELPIGAVWGIGGATSLMLGRLGIKTALDFAEKSEEWLRVNNIAKPLREIHAELAGAFVKKLEQESSLMSSIIKSHTFRPSSSDRHFIFSELSKNIERACDKARRHKVFARAFSFYLKSKDFRYYGQEVSLKVASASPQPLLALAKKFFDKVFDPTIIYRATGVSLHGIVKAGSITGDLFGEQEKLGEIERVVAQVDRLNAKYGAHTVFLASSLNADTMREYGGKRLNIPTVGKITY